MSLKQRERRYVAGMTWILESSLLLRMMERHGKGPAANASLTQCRQLVSSALILDNLLLVGHHIHLLQFHLLGCPKLPTAFCLNRRTCSMAITSQYFENEMKLNTPTRWLVPLQPDVVVVVIGSFWGMLHTQLYAFVYLAVIPKRRSNENLP